MSDVRAKDLKDYWADDLRDAYKAHSAMIQGLKQAILTVDESLPVNTLHVHGTKRVAVEWSIIPHSPDTMWYLWSPYDATDSGLFFGADVAFTLEVVPNV